VRIKGSKAPNRTHHPPHGSASFALPFGVLGRTVVGQALQAQPTEYKVFSIIHLLPSNS
jgi:hypothetical protein